MKKNKLDAQLDTLVRKIYHLKYPNPYCFVCKQYRGWFHPQKNPKGCQIGHYISRQHFSLRWDFLNIFPQCASCNWEHSNRMRGTNPVAFSLAIVEKYGSQYLIELKTKSKESFKKPKKLILLEELKTQLANLQKA